jgi:hypothetical protein
MDAEGIGTVIDPKVFHSRKNNADYSEVGVW